jgi:DNA mismatch endonuclease (patch repair protein)
MRPIRLFTFFPRHGRVATKPVTWPWNRRTSGVMDTVSKLKRSDIMSRVKSKDTRPEMVVRRLLHRLGYGYRLHLKNLPGKPDLTLSKFNCIIFIHGCFWHGCQSCDRGTRRPKSNADFWAEKVAKNRQRDAHVADQLREAGWRVETVWECETTDSESLANRLTRILPRTRSI